MDLIRCSYTSLRARAIPQSHLSFSILFSAWHIKTSNSLFVEWINYFNNLIACNCFLSFIIIAVLWRPLYSFSEYVWIHIWANNRNSNINHCFFNLEQGKIKGHSAKVCCIFIFARVMNSPIHISWAPTVYEVVC